MSGFWRKPTPSDGPRSEPTAIAMICALSICMNVSTDGRIPIPSSKRLRWGRISKSLNLRGLPSLPDGARRTDLIPHPSGFCWDGRGSPGKKGPFPFFPIFKVAWSPTTSKCSMRSVTERGAVISLESDSINWLQSMAERTGATASAANPSDRSTIGRFPPKHCSSAWAISGSFSENSSEADTTGAAK